MPDLSNDWTSFEINYPLRNTIIDPITRVISTMLSMLDTSGSLGDCNLLPRSVGNFPHG